MISWLTKDRVCFLFALRQLSNRRWREAIPECLRVSLQVLVGYCLVDFHFDAALEKSDELVCQVVMFVV